MFGESVLFNFKQGEQVLCVWRDQANDEKDQASCTSDNNDCELLKVKIRKQDEHEEQVLSIDIHMEKQLVVTSDADGLIKIWNF